MARTRSSSRRIGQVSGVNQVSKAAGIMKNSRKGSKKVSSKVVSKSAAAEEQNRPLYYLFKSESESRIQKGQEMKYSIDDLDGERDKTTHWDGVRNFEARNVMRTMKVGELGFFYHSNTKKTRPAIVGIVKVVKEAYPGTSIIDKYSIGELLRRRNVKLTAAVIDHTAFDSKDAHFDAKSTPENPRWFMVDVQLVRKFDTFVSLDQIKAEEKLSNMQLVTRGRISVQKVRKSEWDVIREMANDLDNGEKKH